MPFNLVGLDQSEEGFLDRRFQEGFSHRGRTAAGRSGALVEGRRAFPDRGLEEIELGVFAAETEDGGSGHVGVGDVSGEESAEGGGVVPRASAPHAVNEKLDAIDVRKDAGPGIVRRFGGKGEERFGAAAAPMDFDEALRQSLVVAGLLVAEAALEGRPDRLDVAVFAEDHGDDEPVVRGSDGSIGAKVTVEGTPLPRLDRGGVQVYSIRREPEKPSASCFRFEVETRPPVGIPAVTTPTVTPYILARSPGRISASVNFCFGGIVSEIVTVLSPIATDSPGARERRATPRLSDGSMRRAGFMGERARVGKGSTCGNGVNVHRAACHVICSTSRAGVRWSRRQPRIGQGDRRGFVEKGAKVMICSRKADELEAAEREIREGIPGAEVRAVVADLSNRADTDALAAEALGAFGTVDILVNNAGVNTPQPIDVIDDAVWDRSWKST